MDTRTTRITLASSGCKCSAKDVRSVDESLGSEVHVLTSRPFVSDVGLSHRRMTAVDIYERSSKLKQWYLTLDLKKVAPGSSNFGIARRGTV